MLDRLCFLAVGTTTVLLMASAVRAEESASETQVRVNITLYEESEAETGKKVLADPDIVVTLGRPFSIRVGDQLASENGDDPLFFGTAVQGKIERQGSDALLARLSLAVGNAITIQDAPETQVVRRNTVEVRAPMAIGKVTRIRCGESQTLEVEIEAVRLPADELSHSKKPVAVPIADGTSLPPVR